MEKFPINKAEKSELSDGRDLTKVYDLMRSLFPNSRIGKEEFLTEFQHAVDDIEFDPVSGLVDSRIARKIRSGSEPSDDDPDYNEPEIATEIRLAAAIYKLSKGGSIDNFTGEIEVAGRTYGGSTDSYVINSDGIWRHSYEEPMVLLLPNSKTSLAIGTTKDRYYQQRESEAQDRLDYESYQERKELLLDKSEDESK